MFASRLQYYGRDSETNRYAKIWKIYAREFLGYTNFLEDKLLVNFNKWHEDINYRINLSKRLGLKFTDASRGIVSAIGKGSSFDKMSFQGKAEEMSINDRWKNWVDDKNYQNIFKDEEIIELSKKLYPKVTKLYLKAIEK